MFGRTPRLNERQGRDHHLGNCALVAGAGIRPGQVVGGSSDNGLGPELVDLENGTPDESGVSLKPEHLLTTVLAAAGLESQTLRSEAVSALLSES